MQKEKLAWKWQFCHSFTLMLFQTCITFLSSIEHKTCWAECYVLTASFFITFHSIIFFHTMRASSERGEWTVVLPNISFCVLQEKDIWVWKNMMVRMILLNQIFIFGSRPTVPLRYKELKKWTFIMNLV